MTCSRTEHAYQRNKPRDILDLDQFASPAQMLARCERRFGFFADLNFDEAALPADPYQRKHELHRKLVAECKALAAGQRLT